MAIRCAFTTQQNISDGFFFFAKIVNDWKASTIFGKNFILDVWLGSEYNTPKVDCVTETRNTTVTSAKILGYVSGILVGY